MPSLHHRSHSRHSGSSMTRFFRKLFGKKHISHHSSSFPGINLPRDASGSVVERKTDAPLEYQEDGSVREMSKEQSIRQGYNNIELPKNWFKRYLMKRAIRKERRREEKYRRKSRRAHQKRYRKEEKGPWLGKKILMSGEVNEWGAGKHSYFSRYNPLFRNSSIIFNSTLIFISTYIITYLFYWFSELIMASFYGLDSILYFYDLKFNDHSPLWTRFNILLITGLGPVLCLIAGTFLYKYLFNKQQFTSLKKLFILWLSFHMLNHFFGAFPSGVVTDEGFGYVAAWLYMNTAFKFMFAMVSLFVLGLIGYFSAERILETSDSQSRIKGDRQPSFIFMQMILPWFIGTGILLLIRLPHNFDYPYETLMLFSMIFMVIPPLFNNNVKPRLNLLRLKKRRTIHFGHLTMALVLLLFLKIALGIGLHFIIHISISVSPANI